MEKKFNIILDEAFQRKINANRLEPLDWWHPSHWFSELQISSDCADIGDFKKSFYYMYSQNWHNEIMVENFLEKMEPRVLELMQQKKIVPMLMFMEPTEIFHRNQIINKKYGVQSLPYTKLVEKFKLLGVNEEDITIVHSSQKVVDDKEFLNKKKLMNIKAKVLHLPLFLCWYKNKLSEKIKPIGQPKFRIMSPGLRTFRIHRYLMQYALAELNDKRLAISTFALPPEQSASTIVEESLGLNQSQTLFDFDSHCPIHIDNQSNLVIGDLQAESKFFSMADLIIANETMMPDNTCNCMSEKILTPLFLKKPFIVNGGRGFLAMMHGYGLQTFDGLIDESYDDAQGVERIKLIKNVVRQLLDYDHKQWNNFLLDCKGICNYNYETIKKTNYEESFYKQL